MTRKILSVIVCMMAVVNVASADIEWVYIDDPGVTGHEGFTGYMSKYETTNTQYCEFLNDAKASGDISVDGSSVLGASGSNSGADFVGQVYYYLAGPGDTEDGATNGGAARIDYSGGVFSVDSGFENHPVSYVSWYGATAFCNYYGYRLPTEWEWQAVADYDGSFNYGCGVTIDNSIANYKGSTHPDGTTSVGAFGMYGYGLADLSGNVWEWTSTALSTPRPGWCVVCGGAWSWPSNNGLAVWDHGDYHPSFTFGYVGFRVIASEAEPAVEALVDINPDSLNKSSKGKWITCYIELPEGYDVGEIDVSTVMLNDVVAAESGPTGILDHDGNGVLELMVKFSRAAVQGILGPEDEADLIVTGELSDGTVFEGADTIKVLQ
ncbi:MAG: SUMF1/EgtB/PvdO family nonheme iron enzyme [Sedimentisphaerales bacterium]|nr:SUMF1/EgtB/PvdO family nonheme iron enzyme [Sedimentisphaerales bacterium]